MDAKTIASGVKAFRACIDLPDDVTDAELKLIVSPLIRLAQQGDGLEILEAEIQKAIAKNFPAALVKDGLAGRRRLAEAIRRLADTR